MFKHEYNPKRLAGVAKAKVTLASKLIYNDVAAKSTVDTWRFGALIEDWLETWTTQDLMKGEVAVDEVQIEGISVDRYVVKLTFRQDTNENFEAWADANLRNRLLALELTLENEKVLKLVPMVCSYKYNVPQEVGGVNSYELTFVRAKSVDVFAKMIIDDIEHVQMDCVSRVANVETLERVKRGYEMGVSKVDSVAMVKEWTLGNKPKLMNGNGRQYIFVRSASEPYGRYFRKPYFVNCRYLGATIEIEAVQSIVSGGQKAITVWFRKLAGSEKLQFGIAGDLQSVANWQNAGKVRFGDVGDYWGLAYIAVSVADSVGGKIFVRD